MNQTQKNWGSNVGIWITFEIMRPPQTKTWNKTNQSQAEFEFHVVSRFWWLDECSLCFDPSAMIVYHDTYMWVLKFQKVYYVRGSQSSKHCGILKRHFGKEWCWQMNTIKIYKSWATFEEFEIDSCLLDSSLPILARDFWKAFWKAYGMAPPKNALRGIFSTKRPFGSQWHLWDKGARGPWHEVRL
jgi:hypothetical protein